MPLSICRRCGRPILEGPISCPSCGAINGLDQSAPETFGWWLMTAANSAIVLLFVVGLLRFMGF